MKGESKSISLKNQLSVLLLSITLRFQFFILPAPRSNTTGLIDKLTAI